MKNFTTISGLCSDFLILSAIILDLSEKHLYIGIMLLLLATLNIVMVYRNK